MQTALILVDIQNDYFPGGKMELVGIEPAASNARSVPIFGRAGRNLLNPRDFRL